MINLGDKNIFQVFFLNFSIYNIILSFSLILLKEITVVIKLKEYLLFVN